MVKDASFMGGRSKAPQEQDDKTPLTHPLSTCKSERPYGRDGLDDYYRELRIPKDLAMAPGAEAMAWAEALCCIFTRISVWEDVPSEAYDYLYGFKSGSSRIIFYDGMYKSYDYDDLELMMKNVYTDLCDMSMGNRDCEYSMICVDDALKRHGGNPFQFEKEGDGRGWKSVQHGSKPAMTVAGKPGANVASKSEATVAQRGPMYGDDDENGGDYDTEALLSQREPLYGFEDDDDSGPVINRDSEMERGTSGENALRVSEAAHESSIHESLSAPNAAELPHEQATSSAPWIFATGAVSGVAGAALAGIVLLGCMRRFRRVGSRMIITPRQSLSTTPRNSLAPSVPGSVPSTPRSLNSNSDTSRALTVRQGAISNPALVQLGGRHAGQLVDAPSPLTLPPQICRATDGGLGRNRRL